GGARRDARARCPALRCVAEPDLYLAPSVQEERAATGAGWKRILAGRHRCADAERGARLSARTRSLGGVALDCRAGADTGAVSSFRQWHREPGPDPAHPIGGSCMIGPGTGVRVYLACGVTDMRKGISGLALLAQTVLRQQAASGAVFAFRGRRGDRLKLLY